MKNIYVKRSVCLLLAFLLALGGVWYIDRVLRLKRNDGILTMQNFYRQPKGSVDVLLVGNSHSGINIDTALLWNEYGIAAYNLWGGVQPLWNSYHFLVEALKYQRPKLVVLEITATVSDYEYSEEQNRLKNIAGMKLSTNKLEAVKASAPEDSRLNLLLGLPLYHSRFDEVCEEDFENFPWSKGLENYKGSYLLYGTGNYRFESAEGVDTCREIMDKEREYLIKCIELCRDENIPLLLLKTPALERTWEQEIYNTVSKIADEYSLEFINMNLMDGEVGITAGDWSLDRHMNGSGARKVAEYLGRYISENYSIPDRRGDDMYSSWEMNAHNVNNDYLGEIDDSDDYFAELAGRKLSAVLVKNSPWEDDAEYLALRAHLLALGIDAAALDAQERGVWLIDGNAAEAAHDGDVYSLELDGKPLDVNFEYLTAAYGGKELTWFGTADILCIVCDTYTHEIVDVTAFSHGHHYKLERAE